MSDLAETFQNDISQIFNERGLLRTELIAKEKLLTDALAQKNSLTQSVKQIRIEKDELFIQNQKLKQEKLAAEAEKSASTIHVTILKEEKNLLEEKLYQLTQEYEQSRLQIDGLNRENHLLKNQTQHVPIPIHQTIDHRYELDELKKRNVELEQSKDNLLNRHKNELQLLKNELNAKDNQIAAFQQLISQYEEKFTNNEKYQQELEQRIDDISRSCRSQVPDKLTLTNDELRTIETDPNSSTILAIYRSSKSLFDILVDYARLQKQNENLIAIKEKIDSQRRSNEIHLHQIQAENQQLKIQNERLQFLADSRQTEYEQAIRDKQNLFKEKLELDRQHQQKLREFDDCLDDRNNMRAQIFHLLEQDNIKGNWRSNIDQDILVRQGVVTFNSVEELYEQYMKTLADIRETDRFIVELEETHAKEIDQLTQRELVLKENFEQIQMKLEQTKTDFNIQSLAKQVLDREQQDHGPKIQTNVSSCQTDLNFHDLKTNEQTILKLKQISDEKTNELQRINDDFKLVQQKFDHAQRQTIVDKQKIEELQRMLDESLQRTNALLSDIQTTEITCEQLREQNQLIRTEYDQLVTTISNLRSEIDNVQIEKQQMTEFQEQVLNRIKQDIEIKNASQDDNLLNTRLQQSVDELNSIMKDCIKQTEFGSGTPNHLANLTKLEILYRQLQQRHQYDLEQHFAITESLKIKAKDAQNELIKFQRQYDEMSSKYQDEQKQSANKIAELESKLRNADTTTVLTRLLPSATLETRLKEEEERTQQLRNWTNKLTEKIENIQKQMTSEKKEYEDKMEQMRQELRDSRNENDAIEKRLENIQEEHEKSLNEYKEKEETLQMEIYKLKIEFDSSQMTNQSLKETINLKENEIQALHDRILDFETKTLNLEKEFFELKDKYARQTKEHNLPISEPPSPAINQPDLSIEENSLEASVELKTPGKRRRIASTGERTPMKLRYLRSQSVDCQSTITNTDEPTEDNDDAMSTCSEPPSAKKRKRRGADTPRLPAVDEEGDTNDGTNFQGSSAATPTYNLRSRTRRLPKLQPNQTT